MRLVTPLSLVALCVCLSSMSQAAPDSDETGTIRCAYFYGSDGPGHFATLADHGFNLGIIKLALDPADPPVDRKRLDAIRALAGGARNADVDFMPVLNWAGTPEVEFMAKAGRRFVNAEGREFSRTPCPNDPRQWKYAFEARALAIADEAEDGRPGGMLLDPEMYGANIGMYPGSGCMCDACWRQFLADTRTVAPVELDPAKRQEWLREHGRQKLYEAHQEQVLTSLVRGAREAIHAEYPGFTLGFLLYADTAFFRGLARGMGTPEMPAIIATESTYAAGYSTGGVDDMVTHLQRIGAHVQFVPGLWISRWHPEDLKAHAYHCAKHASGYWLFTTHSLALPPERLKGDYAIPYPAVDYWRALKEANAELNKLHADPDYAGGPALGPRHSVYVPVAVGNVRFPALAPAGAEGPKGLKRFAASRLRGQAAVYLLSRVGGLTRIRLSCNRLGNYGTGLSWLLLGPDKKTLAEGTVAVEETREITVTLPPGSMCVLVGNAGSNTFQVDAENCYETYPVRPWLHLCSGVAPNLYFHVPEGTEEFSVFLQTDNEAETVQCEVLTPLDEVAGAAAGGFPSPHEIRITAKPVDRGKTWRLRVRRASTGVFEDINIRFSDEIPPFISETPDRLLLPASHDG